MSQYSSTKWEEGRRYLFQEGAALILNFGRYQGSLFEEVALIQGFMGCMRFPVAHVILYIQNSLNKTNVKMSMKWLELDYNIVERFGLYFLALLSSTSCYTL